MAGILLGQEHRLSSSSSNASRSTANMHEELAALQPGTEDLVEQFGQASSGYLPFYLTGVTDSTSLSRTLGPPPSLDSLLSSAVVHVDEILNYPLPKEHWHGFHIYASVSLQGNSQVNVSGVSKHSEDNEIAGQMILLPPVLTHSIGGSIGASGGGIHERPWASFNDQL
ncbi:unnamed protein product, partial [Protopolystoma xenopodis]